MNFFGAKTFFRKKRGRRLFFEKKGGKTFFEKKIRGAKTFFLLQNLKIQDFIFQKNTFFKVKK